MNELLAMAQLKAATRDLHEGLEQAARSERLLAGDLSMSEFACFLQGQYLLHLMLEPSLCNALSHWLPELEYAAQRRKLPLLAEDLRDLGLDPDELMPPLGLRLLLPDLGSLPSALGVAYVLEGSTLGAQMIRRHLQARPELAARCGFAYYGCYGDQLGARWKRFGALVNTRLQQPGDQRLACEAARETFALACALFAGVRRAPDAARLTSAPDRASQGVTR